MRSGRVVKSTQISPNDSQQPTQGLQAHSNGVYKSSNVNIAQKSVIVSNKPAIQPNAAKPTKPLASKTSAKKGEAFASESDRLTAYENQLNMFEENLNVQAARMVSDANMNAQSIVVAGKVEAERIINEAKASAAAITEQARLEGIRLGTEQAKMDCKEQLDAAAELLREIEDNKSTLYRRHEGDLVELAIDCAQRVILKSMEDDSSQILEMLKKAAKTFRSSDYIKITMSSLDISAETAGDIKLMREIVGGMKHIEVELSKDVERGTLIIDNGSELVDASVSTQLNMLREIAGRRAKPSANPLISDE